jgi:hypothetical protein
MSCLHYLCLFMYSAVQHILCCVFIVFLRLVYPMLPFSLDFPLLIAPSVFSNVFLDLYTCLPYYTSRSRPAIALVTFMLRSYFALLKCVINSMHDSILYFEILWFFYSTVQGYSSMDNVFVCLVLALCAMKTSGMFLNYFQGIIYNTRIYG